MRLATGTDVVDSVRTRCPSCGVEMWLKGVDRHAPKRTPDAFHFQCTICAALEVAVDSRAAPQAAPYECD